MASVPHTPESAELPLFRFGLRHLFAFVAVVCALLTELVASQGVTGLVLVVVTLVIIAHVTATALGTRLRAAGSRVNDQTRTAIHENAEHWSAVRRHSSSPRPSIWYGYDNSSLARLPALVLAGMALGGIGGAIILAETIGHRTSLLGLAVGAVSIAVLGGWFAFLGSSFCAMFRHGWREAVSEQRKDEAKRIVE